MASRPAQALSRVRQRNGKRPARAPAQDSTRERILSAAARLFAEQGFAGSSMPAIAEASGITAGAIYRHFESKAELLFEVVKRALLALPLAGTNGSGDVAMLPLLCASYTDPALKMLRQLSLEVHSAASRDRDVNRILTRYDEAATRKICDSIEAAQRAQKLDPELNADFTARALTSFIMGLNHMDTLHPHLVGNPAWREFVAQRVAALIGLRPR